MSVLYVTELKSPVKVGGEWSLERLELSSEELALKQITEKYNRQLQVRDLPDRLNTQPITLVHNGTIWIMQCG